MSKNTTIAHLPGKDQIWTANINIELPIAMSKSGLGASIKPETIPYLF